MEEITEWGKKKDSVNWKIEKYTLSNLSNLNNGENRLKKKKKTKSQIQARQEQKI